MHEKFARGVDYLGVRRKFRDAVFFDGDDGVVGQDESQAGLSGRVGAVDDSCVSCG